MTTLVSWLWQGLLVAAAAALLVRLLPRLNAATRHGLWWTALLLIVLLPAVPAALSLLLAPAIEPARAATATAGPLRMIHTGAASFSIALPLPPAWLIATALTIWSGLALMRIAQIARGLAAMARLKRASHPIDPLREPHLPLWLTARHAGRRGELRASDRAAGACVAGLRRPVILLPTPLLRALSDEELDQVVMHEWAHVVRRDDWSRLAQCLLASVFGVHPAVWLVNRRIDFEREAACDDHVLARTGAPRAYAECLAHVATLRLARMRRDPAIVPAAARSCRMLRARVLRLLEGRAPVAAHVRWPSALVGLTALGVVTMGAGLLPPPVTFVHRAATALEALPAADLHGRAAPPPAPVRRAIVALDTTRTSSVPRSASASTTPAPAIDTTGGMPLLQPAAAEATVADAALATPAPLQSRPLSLLVSAAPGPSPARALDGAPDDSSDRNTSPFTAVGTHAAQAGVALGTHLQQMGEHVGRWFAGVARAVPNS